MTKITDNKRLVFLKLNKEKGNLSGNLMYPPLSPRSFSTLSELGMQVITE